MDKIDDKIIPLVQLQNSAQDVVHLIDDGDITREVSSIVDGTQKVIDDGPYTVFNVKNTGQKVVYSNYTNGIYSDKLDPLSDVTEPDAVWEEATGHVKKKTKK